MNKSEIKKALEAAGITGVATTKRVAETIGFSVSVITLAKNRGRLAQIDKNTYAIDALVSWLYANQRYLVNLKIPVEA